MVAACQSERNSKMMLILPVATSVVRRGQSTLTVVFARREPRVAAEERGVVVLVLGKEMDLLKAVVEAKAADLVPAAGHSRSG